MGEGFTPIEESSSHWAFSELIAGPDVTGPRITRYLQVANYIPEDVQTWLSFKTFFPSP